MSAPGGGGVAVSIAGNASSLQAAINQTEAALQQFSAAITQTVGASGNAAAAAQNQAAALNSVSAAANQAAAAQNQSAAAANQDSASKNQNVSAIQQQIAALNNSTAALNYVQSATAVLGSSQAQANIAWAQAATSADDYRQRMALLEAQLRNVRAAQGDVNDTTDAGFQRMMNLGSSIDGLNASTFMSVLQFGDFDAVLGGAAGPVGLLIGLAMNLGSGLGDLGQSVISLAENLGGDLVSAAEQAASALENLLEQTFEVTKATEKNFYNWAFIWGGVNQQTGMGPGTPIATQLLEWSKQASLNMPFTRQDLLQAITTLSVMGGQSPGTVETDLQLLSDIASTQGRPGLTLSWAAMAALRGGEGYSRMLLMDLNISKNELEKFGYNEKDPSSFFPALKLYEQGRGEYGASAYVSQNTFWGASTSLTDRIQNFMLALGGWNDNPTTLTSDVLPGSFFGGLKKDLLDLNKAIDDLNSSGALPHVASLFSSVLGGGVNDARVALEGLITGLQDTGIAAFLFGSEHTTKDKKTGKTTTSWSGGLFGDLSAFVNSSQVQTFLHDVGDVVGSVIGPAMKDAAQGAEAFMNALGGTGIGADVLQRLSDVGKWLAQPATQAGIQQFASLFAGIAGAGATDALSAAQAFLQGLTGGNLGGNAASGLQGILGWLEDPAHEHDIAVLANAIGTLLGGSFQLAAAWAKVVIDDIGSLIGLGGDLAKLLQDLALGQYAQVALDAKQFGADWWKAFQQGAQDTVSATQAEFTWLQQIGQFISNANNPAYGVTPLPGGGSPPIGSKAWQEHMLRALTLGDNGNGVGGPHGDTLALSSVATTGGQQFAQTYIASAQSEFQKAQNGSQLVNALVGGLQQQIQSGGDALGATLYQVIDTHTRAVVTQMLRQYDLFGNADLRQPGGYSIGISLGYR